jgi:type I restriction enzyme S subunit
MSEQLFRDSGQEWLGDIPSHWQLHKIGAHFSERKVTVNDTDYPALSVTMQGIVPQLETAAKSDANDKRKLVLTGDFVINSRSDRRGSSGISPLNGSVSQISIVLKPKGISPHYAHYLLRSYPFQEEFYKWGSGIVADLWSTRFNAMKQILIPLPPRAEQDAIVAFLRRELTKIDNLIAKQQLMIRRLRERKISLTKLYVLGANESVDSETSGIHPWLQGLPAKWPVTKISREFKLTLGKTLNAQTNTGEHIAPYVRAGNIQDMGIDLTEVKTVGVTAKELNDLQLLAEDVLVVEGGAGYGRSDVVKAKLDGWVFQNHVIRARRIGDISPQYLDYYIKYLRSIGHFEKLSAYATIPSISSEALGQIPIPKIPLKVQTKLVTTLSDKLAKHEKLIAKSIAFIDALQSRRKALISSAVFGKTIVRGQK